MRDGLPGKITKLRPSRPLKFPDGLRSTGGQTLVMAEGGGSVDRVMVNSDDAEIETVKDGIAGPTSVALVGKTLWVSEGQLPHLFEAAKSGPPRLPFRNRRHTHEQMTSVFERGDPRKEWRQPKSTLRLESGGRWPWFSCVLFGQLVSAY